MGGVIISGADGFIGAALVRQFSSAGWKVRGLVHRLSQKSLPSGAAEWFDFELGGAVDERALDRPADALVHCAFTTRGSHDAASIAVNRRGAAELLELCRRRGIGSFILISSMSAHEGAVSLYGREKLAMEKMLNPSRDLAVRPGFVIGDGGIFRRLVRSLHLAPFVPLFYGGRQPVQTVHVDDLALAVFRCVERGVRGLVTVAEREPASIRAFYGAILERLGERKRMVPLPGGPALLALRVVEAMGLRPGLTADNLLGLKAMRAAAAGADLDRLGVSPRSMIESLRAVDVVALAGPAE